MYKYRFLLPLTIVISLALVACSSTGETESDPLTEDYEFRSIDEIVDSVEFQSRAMSDGSAITLAFIITTDDGEVLGPFTVPDANSSYDFDVSFEAETLRFDLMDTTGGNTGIVDVAVYGAFLDDAG